MADNRIIKFRVYLDTNEYDQDYEYYGKSRMLSWEDLNNYEDPLNEYFSDGILGCSPPMQYTGLKDKNGIEIYEGDILRIPATCEYEKINYSAFEVFYHDNDCADNHVGFQMNRMHNFGAIAGGFCGHKFLPKTTEKFEVIGNIHENPELISK